MSSEEHGEVRLNIIEQWEVLSSKKYGAVKRAWSSEEYGVARSIELIVATYTKLKPLSKPFFCM